MFSAAPPTLGQSAVAQLKAAAPRTVAAPFDPAWECLRPGRLVEVSGPVSSGKSAFALHHCLGALRRGEGAVWIGGTGFYPLASLEAHRELRRLVWVRVVEGEAVMRAADLLLACAGAASVVVLQLPRRFFPGDTKLLRLQRLAEKSSTLLLLLDERPPHATSLGAVVSARLVVRRHGARGRERLHVDIIRNKTGPTGSAGDVAHGTNRLRFHRTL